MLGQPPFQIRERPTLVGLRLHRIKQLFSPRVDGSLVPLLWVWLAFASHLQADDSLAKRLDSLWIRASSGEERFRDQVEPCKQDLIAMGDTAVPYLVTKLSVEDAREALTLELIFGGIGAPAVPALCAALSDSNIWVLRNIGRALAAIKDKRAVGPLIGILKNPEQGVRSQACTALGKIADTSATLALLPMLADSAETVRKSASVALGGLADLRGLLALVAALGDSYYGVRFTAMEGLVKIGKPAVEPLLKFLDSAPPKARWLAIATLGKIKDPHAEGKLTAELKSTDPVSRAFAVDALVDLGTPGSRVALQKLSDPDPFVQSRLAKAKEKMIASPKK